MKVSINNTIILTLVFIIYFLLDMLIWQFPSKYFFCIIFLQLGIVLFFYSGIGTSIFASVFGCKKIKKLKDKEKLYPLFDEVYQQAESIIWDINPNIELLIDESMQVNAFAIGSNKIAITRGALIQLNDSQIKGILAHEFGHLIHGDNFLSIMLLVGNSYLILLYGIIKIIQFAVAIPEIIFDGKMWFSKFFALTSHLVISLGLLIAEILLLINQRITEYQADRFAFDIGYGNELLKSLYFLDEIPKQKMTMMERLKSSHPNTIDRIAKLENLINQK